jgi:cyclase
MLENRLIPCLLLKNKGLVKTKHFRDPVYIGDPINAVRIFNEKEVDELIFLDISATNEKRVPSLELIAEISAECFMPLSYGGGIQSVEEVEKLLKAGVEKVSINTAGLKNPQLLSDVASLFGSQSLIASIDAKKKLFGGYEVYTHCGSQATGWDPVKYARYVQDLGVGEILLNSIDRDGTMMGFDIDLISTISRNVSIPVVACGGAGKLTDFRDAIVNGGASAAAAGSLFVFHGHRRAVLISYPTRNEILTIFPLVNSITAV